jgi:predicted LPLAT superfamily acyltransferase
MFNPCILIPVYNHHQVLANTVEHLARQSLPVILVDDGSDDTTKNVIQALTEANPLVFLKTLPVNQGKGGAVMEGIQFASQQGFTHALQVDADGQHNLNDIDSFLDIAQQYPESVVCGYPQYDSSVPKHRFYARYLTHIWVWIECLSMAIKDSICGFRVYPIQQTVATFARHSVGRRMDFDTDVLVKLYWDGVNIINQPTQVTYPENGVSHFNLWRDNWLITKMHTKLVFGMLLRSPSLVKRHFSSKHVQSYEQAAVVNEPLKSKERASRLGMRILLKCFQWFGLKPVYWLLYPIILYYYVTSGRQRQNSLNYLNRLYCYSDKDLFTGKPGFWDGYKHFYHFGELNADKLALWSGQLGFSDIEFKNEHLMQEIRDSGKGALLVVCHLGNIDVGRALSIKYTDFSINNIVAFDEAPVFNGTLSKVSEDAKNRLFMVSQLGIDTGIVLKQRVDQGELVVIAGDRITGASNEQVIPTEFLGRKANFPIGPFVLASVLDCPIYTLCSLKQNGKYHIHLDKLSEPLKLKRKSRSKQLNHIVKMYAQRLEYYCELAPYQWFNFFDFWSSKNS